MLLDGVGLCEVRLTRWAGGVVLGTTGKGGAVIVTVRGGIWESGGLASAVLGAGGADARS